MLEQPETRVLPSDAEESVFRSGRKIVLKTSESDVVEIWSPSGELELRIGFDANGPVIKIQDQGRLEIESPETVSVNCGRFEVQADAEIDLNAGGDVGIRARADIRAKADEQAFIDADFVRLNCGSRKGYHDEAADSGEGASE